MLQYMREWVQGLGHQQQSVLQRLTKESVREHRNVRAGGDGKVASATSTAAYGYGHEAQNKINSYVSGIPGVSQVQGLLNQVNRPNMGFGREGPGSSPGMGGSPYRPPSGSAPMPVSASGEAASYYSGGSTPGGGQYQAAGYNTPGGGHYESASYSKTTVFEPPAGPPSSGTGVYAPAMGGHHHSSSGYNSSSGGSGYGGDTRVEEHHARHGYTPSYGPPGGAPPSPGFGGGYSGGPGGPAFPSPGYGGSSAPAFPGADLGRSAPSFPSADGPPAFPDAGQYAAPPGAPPGFPSPGQHGHHGHGHGHGHGHHGGNAGGGEGYYGGPPPGGYTRPPGPPGGW